MINMVFIDLDWRFLNFLKNKMVDKCIYILLNIMVN